VTTVRAIVLGVGLVGAWWPVAAAAQLSAADNHIAYYQRLLQRNPRDAGTYYRLGDAFIRKARETGDVMYFMRAEKALRTSLDLAPRNAGALRHLAYVFYSRHEFADAVVHATKALALDAENGDTYGVLGDAFLEIGRYDDADAAYAKMMDREADLYSYGRRAGLKSLRGDVRGAIADLERAVEIGKTAQRPPESIAWAAWQLGVEHFMIGELEAAEKWYREALSAQPNYYRALGGLAQLSAARQRLDDAVILYRRALGVVPLPEYAAGLGDVLTKAGRADEARKQYDLVEYIGYLNTVNRVIYNRELAYFYADHSLKLATALDLARKELDIRRDVYAYDVLAWTLYKNDQAAEAEAAMAEALKLGTKDAKLFFHAGMIAARLGHRDAAREYLTRVLATNPSFHILHADIARRTLRDLQDAPNEASSSGPPTDSGEVDRP
jgi:tetratricopeptide (TPR) repeat protein